MGQRYAFLDYDGLQRYDQDWLDEFERMALTEEEINDIVDNACELNVFKFTITTTSEKKTGIPFNLWSQDGIILTVDWGDNTTSILSSINFPNKFDMNPATHNYLNAGTYHISIKCNNWNSTYIAATVDNNTTDSIYDVDCGVAWWKKTLVSIDTPFPKLKGVFYISYSVYTYSSYSHSEYENVNFYVNSFKNILSKISLISIPSGLFDKNTNITDFSGCFNNCTSLTSIPSGLFDKNTMVTTFEICFQNCSSLTSIPSGLFDKNTAVTSFSSCFYKCSSLASIPSGLFDKNTLVTDFQYCFSYCSSLLSIPAGLFDSNTAVTDFYQCFYNCSSLQSIPAGLFDKNTALTDFSSCFEYCSSLQSIPEGLFDKNTLVTNFQYCFYGCRSLASIPSGLFDKNTAVTMFRYCFSGCSSLNGFTLNIRSSNVTSANGFVTKKDGVTRTIKVPSGSTTYTTFNSVASSLGLTISTL